MSGMKRREKALREQLVSHREALLAVRGINPLWENTVTTRFTAMGRDDLAQLDAQCRYPDRVMKASENLCADPAPIVSSYSMPIKVHEERCMNKHATMEVWWDGVNMEVKEVSDMDRFVQDLYENTPLKPIAPAPKPPRWVPIDPWWSQDWAILAIVFLPLLLAPITGIYIHPASGYLHLILFFILLGMGCMPEIQNSS